MKDKDNEKLLKQEIFDKTISAIRDAVFGICMVLVPVHIFLNVVLGVTPDIIIYLLLLGVVAVLGMFTVGSVMLWQINQQVKQIKKLKKKLKRL